MTINSFVSLSLDPLLVMASIARSSAQLPAFEASSAFAVNVLGEAQQHLSISFARTANDRFRDLIWEAGITGSPILAGVIAVIECRVTQRLDAGDHCVLIGEAVAARVYGGSPLLFFRGGYHGLSE